MQVVLKMLVTALVLTGVRAASAQKPVANAVPNPVQNPVHWKVTEGPGRPVVGGLPFGAAVEATIDPGWRLYAMDEPDRGPVPTEFTLPEGAPFELLNARGDHPLRHFDPDTGLATTFYEGQASFLLRFRARAPMKAGAQQLPVTVRYQACNATMCLPVRSAELRVPLMVR